MIQEVTPFFYIFSLFFFGVSIVYAFFYIAQVKRAKEELAISLPPPLLILLSLTILVPIFSFSIVVFIILIG